MNTPPPSANASISNAPRTRRLTVTMASTNASWNRRAITFVGTPASTSSKSAWKTGAGSSSTTEVSSAVESGTAVFFTSSMA